MPIIRGWAFEPGSVDGVPMQSETTLSLHLQAQKAGDGNYTLHIVEAHTGAATLRMSFPDYPKEQLFEGAEAKVILNVTVGVDGKPSNVEVVEIRSNYRDPNNMKAFQSASLVAAKDWRYMPETVGGHAAASNMLVPVEFCVSCSKSLDKYSVVPLPGIKPLERATSVDHPIAIDSRVKLLTVVADMTF